MSLVSLLQSSTLLQQKFCARNAYMSYKDKIFEIVESYDGEIAFSNIPLAEQKELCVLFVQENGWDISDFLITSNDVDNEFNTAVLEFLSTNNPNKLLDIIITNVLDACKKSIAMDINDQCDSYHVSSGKIESFMEYMRDTTNRDMKERIRSI